MKDLILQVKNLKVNYSSGQKYIEAVKGVSFSLERGKTLGIVGESGSGKTSIIMAITGLIGKSDKVTGEVYYEGENIKGLSDKKMEIYRWSKIATVFQNRLEVLNPVLSIKNQIEEVLKFHTSFNKEQIESKIKQLANMVNIEENWFCRYPHELSGGMRQKVLIAMALACEPEILILDEPTSSLDAVSRRDIINLLKNIQMSRQIAMIIVSHDISLVCELSSKIEVLYSGYILEEGPTKKVVKNPMHPYTRGLITSSIEINPYGDLWGIPAKIKQQNGKGCPFYQRCSQSENRCADIIPSLEYIGVERKVACNRGGIITLLQAVNLNKTFNLGNKEKVSACNNCNIDVKSGEIVALIGQSGSGKTTLASMISGFLDKDSGKIIFEGSEIKKYEAIRKKEGIQMVFQDPFSSVSGDLTIEEAVREPLDILKIGSKEERLNVVKKVINNVQMDFDETILNKKCSELSGGERQRIAIARSLTMQPKLLIADEICSMLDPSTKANILRLLKSLQNSKGFSMIYITHDLFTARKIADRIFIMKDGQIVDKGFSIDIFNNPKNKYTEKLICQGLI